MRWLARQNPDAAAILDAGPRAVPELLRLLEDPERELLAAVFLSEIGGREAALGLLARWRETRARVQEKMIECVTSIGEW